MFKITKIIFRKEKYSICNRQIKRISNPKTTKKIELYRHSKSIYIIYLFKKSNDTPVSCASIFKSYLTRGLGVFVCVINANYHVFHDVDTSQ